MAKVLDSLTLPIERNGATTNETFVNNPLSTASQFSTSTAYSVGQYVYYSKKLYRFTSAHAAGAWNAGHVTEVTVASELADLKEDTTELKQELNQVQALANAAYVTETITDTAVASFADGADDVPVKSLTVDVTPVQDLHGYDKPWPGGGEKNLFGGSYNELFELHIPSGTTICAYCDNTATINYYGADGETRIDYWTVSSSGRTFALIADAYYFRFNGAEGATPTKMYIAIESGFSGYLPYSNICPISGWTGANVVRTGFNQWDENAEVGGINNANGQTQVDYQRIRSKNFIPCLPGTTYYTNLGVNLFQYDENQNFISFAWQAIGTFTTASNCHYLKFCTATNYGTTYKHDICINLSDPAKNGTYEPYQGNTYSINFPTEAGTVYGGTLDVTSGVLTVDKAIADLGTLNWSYNSQYTNFGVGIANKKDGTTNSICSMYKNSGASSISGVQDKEYYTPSGHIRVKDLDYTDVTSFTNHVNGQQFVYELATPQTYQLNPVTIATLLGQNHIWADCGDTTVDYRADTKLYIENLTAPTEDDMVANTNIPDATYFMVGNTLYLSTTTIPAGDTINPGTNCTQMNLASALNALNS